jgi:pimeloyl-ACP methyl ester carboxylesterase
MHWRQFQELQKLAEIGDRFISYVEAGTGSPLILLHGMPTWGFVFHRALPLLEREHRVLIPDLPGFGFSDRSDRFSRSLSRQSERVAAWMDAAGVERASIAGHDIGAAVALRLAALHPERVDKLCLIDAAAYDFWPAPSFHELGHPSVKRRLTAGALSRSLAKALEPHFASPDPEMLRGLLAPYATEVGKVSLIRDASALDCGETMELAALLPSVKAPTLVLWGDRDALQPLEAGRRLARELPRARLSLVTGAGHFCMIDRPVEFSDALGGFLAAPPLPAPAII